MYYTYFHIQLHRTIFLVEILHKLVKKKLITENNYRQLVSLYTTDNKTAIDHIYTNLPESQAKLHLLETYFSDHKAICALINCFDTET